VTPARLSRLGGNPHSEPRGSGREDSSAIAVIDTRANEGGEMATGKKPASDAGKVLADPKSTQEEKEIAASDLAQAPKKGSNKK
jgi:hypothetical protein